MSAMSEIDMYLNDALECIKAHDMTVPESVDATVLHYDLTDGEKRTIIHFLAKAGYKYNVRA